MVHALLAAGVLGGAMPVFAQTSPPEPPFTETVVVTASSEPAPPRELPASITVISRQEITDRQATELASLLATVPGLTVARSGSPGKVTSLFTRGTNSNHTLVLWNGVALNDAAFGGFDWAFLPTDGVTRLEVVRGPFSALYGSEALGGVVQVITAAEDGLSLRLEGGGNGYQRAGLAAAHTFGNLRLDVAGGTRRGDGEVDNDFYDGDDLLTRLTWTLSSEWSLGLVARGARNDIGVPFGFDGSATPRRTQERESLDLAVPIRFSRGPWSVESVLSTTRTELRFADPDDVTITSRNDADRDAARVTATYRFREGLWATVGGELEREEATTTSFFGGGLDGAEQDSWGAFGELYAAFGPVRLDLGVRRDDYDSFGAETSVKVGAVVDMGSRARLIASFGQGFRAPSLGDLYFPFFGNPDLAAERSESSELGFDWSGSAWRARLTGFHTDQDDLIVFDFVTNRPENIGRGRARGVEGEFEVRLASLDLLANATWQEAENRDTGAALLRRPERAGNLLATYRPAERWTAQATLRYVGPRPDFGGDLPGFTTLQLGGAYRWTERFEPYARVENVLDREYEEVLGFPAPGRTFVGGLAIRF